MRRLTAWLGGALGGIAAYKWFRGRPQVAVEPTPAEPDEPPEAVEERRQRVHDEARSTLDEMKPQ